MSPRLLNFGPAVMLKFTHLSDLIDRIKLCYTMYMNSRPTAVDTPPLLEEAVNESNTQTATDQSENISPEMSAQTNAVQREVDVTFVTQASPAHGCNLTAAVMNPVVDDLCDDVM